MIQAKLEAYRRKKREEEMKETIKNSVKNILPWNRDTTKKVEEPLVDVPVDKTEDVKDTDSTSSDDETNESQSTVLNKLTYALYFLLWAVLYFIAIELQFGAVYFILSTLVFIWLNTRSRPKKKGEPSAYSVFNPNCEAIEGTLDASQFEREIRYGVAGMH